MRAYAQPELEAYDALLEAGRAAYRRDPAFLEAEIEKGRGDDTAAMFFTSGTTGTPKGVVLTHHALIDRARAAATLEGLTDRDVVLAYLPPAWIGQNIFSYAQPLVTGYCICCPESAETLMTDMREIGPSYYFAPPRVLEALLTQVSIRMEDAGRLKRWLYRRFMDIARRVGGALLDGKPVGALDRLRYALGDLVVYGPLRNVLGMSRVRVAYTAGEAIGPDLFKFYRSIGINLKQLYGSTETSVFVCVQPDGQVKPDTVGPAVPGVELKFTPERELLIRSPGLFKEYYKNPEATLEAKDARGLVPHRRRRLRRCRRAPEDHRPREGRRHARRRHAVRPEVPGEQAQVLPLHPGGGGLRRTSATACARSSTSTPRRWATGPRSAASPYSGYVDLASRDEVYELVRECIERVNADLAQEPELARLADPPLPHPAQGARRGRRRAHAHAQGAPALRRARSTRALVDALYGGRDRVHVEARVRYEDGRTGSISADLKIRDAKTFRPEAARARRMSREATIGETDPLGGEGLARLRRREGAAATSRSTCASTRCARSSARTAPARARC